MGLTIQHVLFNGPSCAELSLPFPLATGKLLIVNKVTGAVTFAVRDNCPVVTVA